VSFVHPTHGDEKRYISERVNEEYSVVEIADCCDIDAESGVVLVHVPVDAGAGELAVWFFRSLHDFIVKRHHVRAVIDFRDVAFVVSIVLSDLLALHKAVGRIDGAVCLCGLSPMVRETLRKTRLDTILLVRDDVDSASDALTP
jgi:anti-anti-sigma factor